MKKLITPTYAQELLDKNTHNRPMSDTLMHEYAESMFDGNWVYNGESIKVSSDGTLLDGQHRLRAVVASGKSITSEILTDLDNDVFGTIDVGKSRTLSDSFAVKGVTNYKLKATILNGLYMLNNKKIASIVGGSGSRISHSDMYDYYLAHKWVIDATPSGTYIGVTQQIVLSSYAYLLQFHEGETVALFFNTLKTGVAENDNCVPVIKLRDWFIKTKLSTKYKPTKKQSFALLLKTFKHYIKGEKPKILRWHEKAKETFPYDDKHIT